LKDIAKNRQQYGYNEDTLQVVLSVLKDKGASFFDVKVKNLDYTEAKSMYMAFLKNIKVTMIVYAAAILSFAIGGYILIMAALAFYALYTKSFICYFDFYRAIDRKARKNITGIMIGSLFIIWAFYPYLKKQMKEDMESVKW
jgi:hypothetical protein